MISFNTSGFDELEKQLEQMEQGAKELGETKQVTFGELFTTSFMQEYTPFSSLDELFTAGGFNVESSKDFEAIPDVDFDRHIAAVTQFKSWDDMLGEAVSQYTSKKLGF